MIVIFVVDLIAIYIIWIIPINFVHPRIIVFAVNCKWSDFGSWSNCSAPCGKGEQNRTRTVLAAASNGGNDCTGTHEEIRTCKIKECPGTVKILSLLVTYCIIVVCLAFPKILCFQ